MIKNRLNFFCQRRFYISCFAVLVSLVWFGIITAHAADPPVQVGGQEVGGCSWYNITCWVPLLVATLASVIVYILGQLIVGLVFILVWISQYNGFISSPVVVQGWSVVRDISNMFFVLVLLIISFGTILHVQQYQMKTLLPKVILMAILVNFSKAIAGLFIDFAQVVMLTFVAAYQGVGAGNLFDALKLQKILSINSRSSETIQGLSIAGAYILALIYTIVALIVILAFVLILIVRIVMLWILVVFSPLSYVLSVVPAGQKYAQQWWDMFSKYVIIGPVLAFFLWLSLATLPNITESGPLNPGKSYSEQSGEQISDLTVGGVSVIEAGSPQQMVGFIISIAMLIMSLVFAQQVGGAVGKIAGNAYGKITSGGAKMALAPLRGATWAGGKAVNWGGRRFDDFQAGLQKRFMNTKYGQKIAQSKRGQRWGLGALATQGVQIRTLKTAWEERAKRVERDRLGASAGTAEDILSRIISRGQEQETAGLEQHNALVAEEQKKIAVMGEDQEVWVKRLADVTEEYGDVDQATGKRKRRVKKGDERRAEGILLNLVKNHDLNEIMKHEELGTAYNHEYTPETTVQLIKDLFGEGQENQTVARVAFRVQEVGLQNDEGFLKGIASNGKTGYKLNNFFGDAVQAQVFKDRFNRTGKRDEQVPITESERATAKSIVLNERRTSREQQLEEVKNVESRELYHVDYAQTTQAQQAVVNESVAKRWGGTSDDDIEKLIKKEQQANYAAVYIAKRSFRSVAQQARFQDFMPEFADGDGNRIAGQFGDQGAAIFKASGAALATQWGAMNEETRKYLQANIDQFVKYFENFGANMKKEEKESFAMLLTSIARGKAITSAVDIGTMDDLNAAIKANTPGRVELINKVNANRRTKGLEVIDVLPTGYEATNSALFNSVRPPPRPTAPSSPGTGGTPSGGGGGSVGSP